MDNQDDSVKLALLRQDVENMKREVSEIKQDVRGLVEAWQAANWLVSFIKWLAGVGVAVGLVLGWVKGWIR